MAFRNPSSPSVPNELLNKPETKRKNCRIKYIFCNETSTEDADRKSMFSLTLPAPVTSPCCWRCRCKASIILRGMRGRCALYVLSSSLSIHLFIYLFVRLFTITIFVVAVAAWCTWDSVENVFYYSNNMHILTDLHKGDKLLINKKIQISMVKYIELS